MNTDQFNGHTPGPWWIDEVSDNGHKDTWLMGNSPQDDMLLCMEFAESNEADARLIAAAPDLLDLLKDARRMVKELHALLERVGHEDDAYEWALRNIGEQEMAWWNPEACVGDEE